MKLGWRHWAVAVAVATVFHAALLAMFLALERSSGDAKASHGAVEISLSLAAPTATADAAAPINPTPAVAAKTVEEVEIEPDVTEARPLDPIETVSGIVPVEHPTEFITVATTKPLAPLRALSEVQSVPAQTVAPPVTMTASPTPPSGTAAEVSGHRDDYSSHLRAWLERHKKYPRNARLRRQEGTVTVRFTVQPSGQLLSYAIERGSGFALLDREALAMFRRAAPLPAIPESLGRDSVEFVLPISFYLR